MSQDTIENTKIKFNQYNGDTDPMDEYKRDPEKTNSNGYFGELKPGILKWVK